MTEIAPLPAGPFGVIYADPPWAHHHGNDRSMFGQAKLNIIPYPVMSMDELKSIPVADAAAKDSILFLWVIQSMLLDCIAVGEAWGYQYVTIAFAWDKVKPIPGYYTMPQIELCLLMKRGKQPEKNKSYTEQQFLSQPRTHHSAKPAEVRKRIHRMFPNTPKLEMFARPNPQQELAIDSGEGEWTFWGNEV